MLHHLEILRKPLPTRSTNFPSSTLRCITASRRQCTSVSCVVVQGRPVGSVLPQKGSSCARTKWNN
ncbi:hypothetical protein ACHAXR_001228 [Thalassiosira sp. AJA248-18]